MSPKERVLSRMQAVAAEHKLTLASLRDDLLLKESGLDSLCFALVVVGLEDDLGYNPFAVSEDTTIPQTLGEFIQLYEKDTRSAATSCASRTRRRRRAPRAPR